MLYILVASRMPLDDAFLHWLNGFAHHWRAADEAVVMAANNPLVKGAVLVLFCWAWFRNDARQAKDRQYLIAGLWTPFLAFLIARAASTTLPFRVRPLADPNLHLQVPYGINFAMTTFARTWSSFPSDHAACFGALAMTVMLVSHSAGLLAFLYTLLLIDLPRVYLGFHYPSDILGGTLIGVALAAVIGLQPVRERVATPLMRLHAYNPGLFYAGFFLLLYGLGHVNAIDDLLHFGFNHVGLGGKR